MARKIRAFTKDGIFIGLTADNQAVAVTPMKGRYLNFKMVKEENGVSVKQDNWEALINFGQMTAEQLKQKLYSLEG